MENKSLKEILDQSWQHRLKKQFPEAELLLSEAMEKYVPGSLEYKTLKANLADVLIRQGKTSEAKQTALEVLEIDPHQVVALTALGMAALDGNAAKEAVDNLQKAVSLAPNAFRFGRLARALETDHREEEALKLLKEALQRYPRDGYLLKQYASLQKKIEGGDPAKTAGQGLPAETLSGASTEEDFLSYAENMRLKLDRLEPGEAVSQLQKMIKIGPRKNNPHLHLLLGDMLRRAGDETAAAEAYRKARELDPENLLALSQLLYSYRRLGKKEESWPLLKLLLYHRPGDKTAKASLLKDAVELGKEKETALFFEELLQKYPQRKEFYGAIRKLMKAAELKDENRQED